MSVIKNRLAACLYCLVFLSGISLTNSAAAQTLIQSESFMGTPNYSAVLTFDQFDSSLGVLTGIQVDVEFSATEGRVHLDNDAATAAVGSVEYGSTALLSSPDVILLNDAFNPVIQQINATLIEAMNLAADDGDAEVGGTPNFSFAGPDAALLGPIDESDSDSGNIASDFFAIYTGNGTYDLIVDVDQTVDFGGIGGISFLGFPIQTEGTVTVTYFYTAIPEPATCSLLCLSFGLIGLRRRRTI